MTRHLTSSCFENLRTVINSPLSKGLFFCSFQWLHLENFKSRVHPCCMTLLWFPVAGIIDLDRVRVIVTGLSSNQAQLLTFVGEESQLQDCQQATAVASFSAVWNKGAPQMKF